MYDSEGTCATTSYEGTLTSPFSAARPASYLKSDYAQVAESDLKSYLGFATCQGLGDIFATDLIQIQNATTTSSPPSPTPSTAESYSTDKRPAIQRRGKIGIGIGVPIVLILFGLLVLYVWRNFRKKPDSVALDQTANPFSVAKDGQPYLQQKAELEDEARRKYELEAPARMYELSGDDTLHEISAVREDHPFSYRTEVRQELRGKEHAQELGNADL